MNCHELQSVLSEVARDQIIDASVRDKALSHTESCARCAARLADERALTGGLRMVAAASESDEAQVRVEAALAAAFRDYQVAAPVHAFGSASAGTRRWLYIAAGFAAAAVIVVLLSLTVSRTQDPQPSAPEKANQESDAPNVEPSPKPANPPVKEKLRRRSAASVVAKKGSKPQAEASSSEVEIATDFFPLMNRESWVEPDSGQIVRVELPRSALMSFGLPMNMERASERVKADVVVGNDGLARAIRFVR